MLSFANPLFYHLDQATAGTDLVKKCIASLVSGTSVERLALVDGFGYDAFPALATLEATCPQ